MSEPKAGDFAPVQPDGMPAKRKRKQGRSRPPSGVLRFVRELVQRPLIYELGAVLPHLDDDGPDLDGEIGTKRRGRRPEFPPEVFLLFLATKAKCRWGDDDVEELLGDELVWDTLSAELYKRFPQYPRLAPGGAGPTRSQVYRWKRSLREHQKVLDTLLRRFTQLATEQAVVMDMFDLDRAGYTDLHLSDAVIGDGTFAASMFKATAGDLQWDPVTKMIEQKRHDPYARHQIQKRDGETTISDSAGTHYGFLHATNGAENEIILLDVFHVPAGPGHSEISIAVDHIAALKTAHLPGLKHVMWDKAVHGKEIDQLYQHGIMTHAKVSRAPGGGPKTTMIDAAAPVRQAGTIVGKVTIDTIGGAAHLRVTIDDQTHRIALTPAKRTRVKNATNRKRPYRWYQEYTVPDDPRIAKRLRGGLIRLRLDTTDEDRKRKLNRAENLRPVAEDDEAWNVVGGQRSRAESVNSKVKARWKDSRIAAVGVEHQLLVFLGYGIMLNTDAQLCYERRPKLVRPAEPDPPDGQPLAA